MNAMTPFNDFKPAYWQLMPIERKFVDGYVADLESIADKSGQRLVSVLHQPFPFELDDRGRALLALPLVRAAIAERIQQLSDTCDISIYRTLKELTCVGYANIANYVEIDPISGTPEINLSKCTVEQLAAVKSFEIEDKPRGGRKYKFVLHDKLSALNTIATYQGLLGKDSDHWRTQEQAATKTVKDSRLPASMNADDIAALYQREING